jgi:hypothetical protein
MMALGASSLRNFSCACTLSDVCWYIYIILAVYIVSLSHAFPWIFLVDEGRVQYDILSEKYPWKMNIIVLKAILLVHLRA